MKHKHKDIEGSRREFAIEIPTEEVKAKLDEIYEEIRKNADIAGFRRGKAPRDILEKHHGEAAREKVLNDLVSDSYRKALKDSDTIPVGMPQISDVKFSEGQPITYKAIVDVRPKIDLKNYKNIKVTKKPSNVKEEDVEKYLSTLRESYAQFKSVEDRSAKIKDYLVCDVACEIDGKPIYDERKNIWLHLDREQSIPELVDGLVGTSKGDAKEINAVLPEKTGDPKYSKKKAIFKVKVNQIKEKELPEVNDEFAKGLGPYQNVAELKEAAKKDLIRKQESRIKSDMSYQILEHLLKSTSFLPPKGLISEEVEALVNEAKEDLKKKNVKDEDIKKNDAELRKNSEKEAIRRVRLYFILDEIAKLENISVTDDEVDKMLSLLAQQSNSPKEEVKKHYQDNNLLGSLKSQLRENKIIDFLLNNADVKETK